MNEGEDMNESEYMNESEHINESFRIVLIQLKCLELY